MPLLACSSVRVLGSVGLSLGVPAAVEVKSLSASLTKTVETIEVFPEAARSGVAQYS
jgi:hypothetical protein